MQITINQTKTNQAVHVHKYHRYLDREPEEDRYVWMVVKCCLECGKYSRAYATEAEIEELK